MSLGQGPVAQLVVAVEAWYGRDDDIKSGLGRLGALLCWLEGEGRIRVVGGEGMYGTIGVDLEGLELLRSSDPEWNSRSVRSEAEQRALRLGASMIQGKRYWLFVVGEAVAHDARYAVGPIDAPAVGYSAGPFEVEVEATLCKGMGGLFVWFIPRSGKPRPIYEWIDGTWRSPRKEGS